MEADDYLMMSGIQHYCFCRRQWALIHIEQQWKENWRTIAGNIIHERVHDSDIRESRGDMFVMRGLQVSSSILQLSGICDSVEFVYDIDGISIAGHVGCWRIIPVEYKRIVFNYVHNVSPLRKCFLALLTMVLYITVKHIEEKGLFSQKA